MQFLGDTGRFMRKASLKDRPEVYELSPLAYGFCILSALCRGHCKELGMVQVSVPASQLYVSPLATPRYNILDAEVSYTWIHRTVWVGRDL